MKNYDDFLLPSFISFLKKRENPLSNRVDIKNTKRIYNSFIKPLLSKGEYSSSMSKNDLEKFAGELFALSMFAKKHEVCDWVYEPKINDLTPDFSVNRGNYILEIYTPTMNHNSTHLNYYLKADREQLRKKVENKSKQYKFLALKILVHVVVGDFTNDLIGSLKKVRLANASHDLYLYHGEREYVI